MKYHKKSKNQAVCEQKSRLLLVTIHVHFQEYLQDGIDWTKVDFEDNQDCLSLFEKVQNLML